MALTKTELSLLLYLLDALYSAPNKRPGLLSIANHPELSNSYQKIFQRLRDCEQDKIVELVEKIREELL
jgi:hypothetical protein